MSRYQGWATWRVEDAEKQESTPPAVKKEPCEHGRKHDEQCDACELIWIFNGK